MGGRQGSGDHKAGRQQRAHPNPGGEEAAGVMDGEGPGGQRLWRGPSPGSSHHAGQAHGDRSEPPPKVWAAGLGPGRVPRGGQGPPWELLDPSECGAGSRRPGLSTAAGDSRVQPRGGSQCRAPSPGMDLPGRAPRETVKTARSTARPSPWPLKGLSVVVLWGSWWRDWRPLRCPRPGPGTCGSDPVWQTGLCRCDRGP